jgi:hypothetical protein
MYLPEIEVLNGQYELPGVVKGKEPAPSEIEIGPP